jgi:hypothetical protein
VCVERGEPASSGRGYHWLTDHRLGFSGACSTTSIIG